MTEPRETVILRAIEEVAARAEAAGRLEPPGGEAVLRSVTETAVAVFDAQAASLAFHDRETDKLVIRVAAGPAGPGAIGLAFPSGEGIAGYVFATGQPLAVGDVAADPRFDRTAAERTGYIPRSILAVPLVDDDGVVGVMEVLDRRSEDRFALRDLELASVFARQAIVAVRASQVERATTELLRQALVRLAADPDADADAVAAVVAEAAAGLDADGDGRLWALADAVARARHAAPEHAALVVEILDALARRAARPAARTFRR